MGGGCKIIICCCINMFIVIDMIDLRNDIFCMWFGECIDVGSKYSFYKILM